MAELTKEWLLKTITELEEERDATPGAVNEDAARALEAMKLALASLEAEAVALRDERSGSGGISKKPGFNDLPHGTPLYAAPPAPVALPVQHWEELCRQNPDMSIGDAIIRAAWWNHCATMLQGADGNSPAHSGCRPAQNCISPAQCGNSPAIPDGWVMVPEEPTHEMLEAGDEQFGTYDVYRRMIAASPQQEVK
ncbi:hypothetical protein EA145_09655 [Enterobacter hormaechei]|uniref:hypothetical protein n=1 Tax=Enterobacter hormaechei TaxID=158836 RepID=UPI000DA19893|nr:hypothetical protein [Enterobacter hormaechei]MCU3651199.1 hypothetical protein [Enterobacter hormaechei subsp. xiangfangensis]MDX7055362.1 hypothetical protein [Enterobacter hormaechei]PZA23641.1 hypothetical protein C7B73_24500 [Enterobacter hormaechei]RLZ34427.1 hypothetical protein EA145_09655 [Enterobacter hormaechei]